MRKGANVVSHLVSLLIIAFALSLDSCSVGFTYGLRKVHIPYKSIIIISICSMIILMISMGIGELLTHFISIEYATMIGGILLILIGIWVLIQFLFISSSEEMEEKTLINIEIKSLGLVIHILRKPTIADFDKSGTIVGIEAFFLGASLSLDSFGAGLGISLLGYPIILTSMMIGIMGALFLIIGMHLGRMLASIKWLNRLTFIPGIILIVIGVMRI